MNKFTTQFLMPLAALVACLVGAPGMSMAQTDDAVCVTQWEQCLETDPEPGKARAHAKKCDKDFRKCIKAEKRDCKKECKAMKKAAKRACKAAFKETSCPNGGAERRACMKDARQAKKECKKAAAENCKKLCKP